MDQDVEVKGDKEDVKLPKSVTGSPEIKTVPISELSEHERGGLVELQWASSAHTTGGILLVLAGIINMMARIDITINLLISILLVTAGYGLLKRRDWGPSMGIISTIIAIVFSILELALFYFVFPELIRNMTGEAITGRDLVLLGAMFIVPMVILCIIALFISHKLKYRMRMSQEELNEWSERHHGSQFLGNCPVCGYNELEFTNGVWYRCAKCGYKY